MLRQWGGKHENLVLSPQLIIKFLISLSLLAIKLKTTEDQKTGKQNSTSNFPKKLHWLGIRCTGGVCVISQSHSIPFLSADY